MRTNKLLLLLASLLCLCACSQDNQEPEPIPSIELDVNLKAYLLAKYPNVDKDNDGQITETEALAVQELDFRYDAQINGGVKITSLTGIEAFKNLKNLNLSEQSIEDASKIGEIETLTELDLSGNQIKSLDLSRNKLLERLYLNNNKIKTLNLESNSELSDFRANENELETIKLSYDCKKLIAVQIKKNKLSVESLDEIIKRLPNVENVPVQEADASWKKCLMLSENPGAEQANLKDAKAKGWTVDVIPSADKKCLIMSVGAPAGTNLMLRIASQDGKIGVKLGEAKVVEYDKVSNDVKKMTTMNIKTTEDNQEITLQGEILAIDCKQNKITTMSFPLPEKLQLLDCSMNQLARLDVSNCKSLKYLYCMENQISLITLGENSNMEEIIASFNKLSDIQLGGLPALKAISVDKNSISSIDVSKNINLEKFYCKKNKIANLNIGNLLKLKELSATQNKIEQIDLSKNSELQMIDLKDNSLKSLDLKKNAKATSVNVSVNELSALELSGCTMLTELYCYSNSLGALDLSGNKMLNTLSCGDNKLETIDLSALSHLQTASVSFNRLTSIKISQNANISAIDLTHNKLSAINFTGCTSIVMMDVSFNQFTIEQAKKMIDTLPVVKGDEPGIMIYKNSEEYPDDTEGNQYSSDLATSAKAKNWVMSNGDEELTKARARLRLRR